MFDRIRDFFRRRLRPNPVAGRAASAKGPRDAGGAVPERIVVGLGNPGPEYARTRHNAGFLVVERLAERQGAAWSEDAALEARVARVSLRGGETLLLEPQTYMNRSGRSVEAALERWPTLDAERDLVVVYDDLDLPTGRIRLRPSGGAGGHRGMGDIQAVLDTKAIPRLRFGIGHPGRDGPPVVDYVLGPFPEAEEPILEDALERAADALEAIADGGFASAMGAFNART